MNCHRSDHFPSLSMQSRWELPSRDRDLQSSVLHLIILHSSHFQSPLFPHSLSSRAGPAGGSRDLVLLCSGTSRLAQAGPCFVHSELWPQTRSGLGWEQHGGAAEPGLADGECRLYILKHDLAQPSQLQTKPLLSCTRHHTRNSPDLALTGWGTGES